MRRIISLIIITVLLTGTSIPAFATTKAELDTHTSGTASYILQTVGNPQVGNIGGDWAVLGLARSKHNVPDSYYENYYRAVERYVKDHNGVLHERRYTDYSRVILSLTAAGYDPRDVAGYDLTKPLGDFERSIWQGLNGPIWALIALDSLDYAVPVDKDAATQATRELYITEILRRQTPDGGWNLTAGANGETVGNEKGDADLTGMALQALAKYQNKPDVKTATDKALAFLSGIQDAEGGFSSNFSGDSSAIESVVQVIVALCELGVQIDDARFTKNGNTLANSLLRYRNADGSYRQTHEAGMSNQMSTEQALYALVAMQRAADGANSLYRMSDAARRADFEGSPAGFGLQGKHIDVRLMPVIREGMTFDDIQSHDNKTAIEALAGRGIINGKTDALFDPDATMTRAEFAAIVTRSLGLSGDSLRVVQDSRFVDVVPENWFFEYVYIAYSYEIVNGTSPTTFVPHGTITRQEAAVMTARAARLAGLDTTRGEAEIRDTLAPFGDYRSVAEWALSSLAFCYSAGIIDDMEFDIKPVEPILRCEIAEMLYRLLDHANLL